MTKTPKPQGRIKWPSPPTLAAMIGGGLGLVLTVWIFAPGGLLSSLIAPQETTETPDLLINEQEAEVPADLSPEKNAEFLAENAKKPDVEVTDSGLQYRQISAGDGARPEKNSVVTVHYTGALINGKVFDSSLKRGQPISFGLDQVIPGWTEGVQKMRVGEKAELVIPQDLGYGARGAPGAIPPYQTLVFEVELLAVQ